MPIGKDVTWVLCMFLGKLLTQSRIHRDTTPHHTNNLCYVPDP
jgi:hypothetical protein